MKSDKEIHLDKNEIHNVNGDIECPQCVCVATGNNILMPLARQPLVILVVQPSHLLPFISNRYHLITQSVTIFTNLLKKEKHYLDKSAT